MKTESLIGDDKVSKLRRYAEKSYVAADDVILNPKDLLALIDRIESQDRIIRNRNNNDKNERTKRKQLAGFYDDVCNDLLEWRSSAAEFLNKLHDHGLEKDISGRRSDGEIFNTKSGPYGLIKVYVNIFYDQFTGMVLEGFWYDRKSAQIEGKRRSSNERVAFIDSAEIKIIYKKNDKKKSESITQSSNQESRSAKEIWDEIFPNGVEQ